MDRIDAEIVRLLQNDGRLSNKALAARVGLAPSTCFERVRQLRAGGVITGVHAEVRPQALGVGLEAMYFISLNKHSRDAVEAFRRDIELIAEVRAVYLVAGRYDFLVHVAVRDADHLRDLALDAFTVRPEVTGIETVLIFDHTRRYALPNLLAGAVDAPA
ncbi:MAG: Lrp/AsnC family transcriptional regulator [Gammaproteobacteria bacterium]|nr:Lrp/AsnC family transcriptional regulator [Gammaproteobacteria bacterium]